MPTTSNFGWTTPADTDLVKDGALAIRTLGNGIDTSMAQLKGGTTGQVLSKTNGTDMAFTWVTQDDANAIQNAIVDAKGDLITATAADTPARLAVGTNGQILTADSTTATGLKWAAGASSSWVKITSGTISASAATNIDSLFSSTYKHYVITLDNLVGSTGAADLLLQFRTTVPATYALNYYGGALKLTYNSSTPTNIQHNGAAQVTLTEDIGAGGGSGVLFITASSSGTFSPSVQGFIASHNAAINTAPNVTTDPISAGGIRLSVSTGTFSTNYIVYGVAE